MKKINVFGKENIPKKGPILFIGNHQNALIDALLIPATNNRKIHFLARASAFKNSIARKLLESVNMIPVYRLRDGIKTIEKNFEIFDQCIELLNEEKAIEIFAEGEHHLSRRIIPLKKGFARIILGTLQKYPHLNIQIVPIGLNFDSHLNFPSSASIYYGKPINANQFFDLKNPDFTFKKIINEVASALKKLTLHIENEATYNETIAKLEKAGVNYLNPFEANKMVKNIESYSSLKSSKNKKINWFLPFHLLAKLNSIFPLLIWRYLKSTIKDLLFMNTFRFAVITTLFPLFYIIQAVIVYAIFNLNYALVYLAGCILLGIITSKTMDVQL